MTDCYRILGISPSASQAEIRAAYLAKMKLLHPDAGNPGGAAEVVGDVTVAYWHLRDQQRRAEHDRLMLNSCAPSRQRPTTGLPTRPSSRRTVPATKSRPPARKSRRRGPRLQWLRAASGVAGCALVMAAVAAGFPYLLPDGSSRAHAAAAPDERLGDESPAQRPRRTRTRALVDSASEELQALVDREGGGAARVYARQCLTELKVRPSLTMLDYCLAFDDVAADWETEAARSGPDRFFASEQRFDRYRSVARALRSRELREALLSEANHLVGAGS